VATNPDTTLDDSRRWLNAVDASSAAELPYGFCKRHGVLVAARDGQGHHLLCTD